MRLLLGLIASATLTGCFGFGSSYDRCASASPFSKPSEYGVYEERKPEAGGPILARAPSSAVGPGMFAADAWAASVFATLPARSAPDLTPRDVLVCAFQTIQVAGIDDIDTPSGKLRRSSMPDFMVTARFDGHQITRGPAGSTTSATFTFRTELHEGDPVIFNFGDHDYFSQNDFIGKIQGNYFGKLPFEIKGKAGSATCNAAAAADLEKLAEPHRRALEALLVRYEKHAPTLQRPLATDLDRPIRDALGAIEFFSGDAKEETARANERLREATGSQFATFGRMLEKQRSSLPRAGTWVKLGDRANGRVSGVRCQVGRQLVQSCVPILEIELLTDADTSACTDSSRELLDPIDSLGPIHAVESSGRIFPAYAFDKLLLSRSPGPAATPWQLKKGDIVRIPLAVDGLRESHTNWTVPMIRIGSTYLRVD